MTVLSSTSRSGPYAGSGLTGPYTIGFKFLSDSHLEVIKTEVATGLETILTLTTDYTATGAGSDSGGTLTLTSALSSAYTLTIQLDVPITQELDYVESDGFPAESHEAGLDKLTQIAQIQKRILDRTVRAPESAAAFGELPSASARANRTLGFDASGNPTVLTPAAGSAASVLTDLANAADVAKGAALVAFTPTLAYASGSVGARLRDLASQTVVQIANAAFDNTTDDRAAIQAAIDALSPVGGVLVLPRGYAKCSGHLTVPANVSIRGQGKLASGITFTHTGDGIRTVHGVNAPFVTRNFLADFFISNTNAAANTGGGLVDVCSTEFDVWNLYIENFKYQVIFDQTEVTTLRRCDLNSRSGQVGLWLVNGADHSPAVTFTVAPALGATSGTLTANWSGTTGTYNLNFVETVGGASESRPALLTNGSTAVTWSGALSAACNVSTTAASSNYTNRIVISENEFQADAGALENIRDDGGSCHTIQDNNFNAGSHALRASGVYGLTFTGNESEVHTSGCVVLTNSKASGAFIAPCQGIDIRGNLLIDPVATHIDIVDAQGGRIVANTFGQATSRSILFSGASNPASGLLVANNTKVIAGAAKQSVVLVDTAAGATLRNNQVLIAAQAYVTSALGATGSQTITPTTMEGIRVGTPLVCQNADGTNFEIVTVTAITSTTFTATFASTKSANWLVTSGREDTGIRQRAIITYSASMTPNTLQGDWQIITATNGTAFTINAPTNALNLVDGAQLTITLKNSSGGALGAATWNAVFKMSTWTNPANGQNRSITFRYDSTNWVQVSQTGVDVPN